MANTISDGEFLVRQWLDQWSWASARELSKVTGISVQNVNRHLRKMKKNGVADYRVVGRGREAVRRWFFTSEKSHGLPPDDHDHDETGRGADGHRHHPRLLEWGHTHAWWWQSEFGHQRIFDMLGPNGAFREVALHLFPEANGAWSGNVGDVVKLTSWIPLRRGRIAEAIAIYSDGEHYYYVVFCWVGKQVRRNRLIRKWSRRFDDLQWEYLQDRKGEPYPQPSAYVIVGEDEHSVRMAMQLLPRAGSLGEEALSFWVAESPCRKVGEYGAVIPYADFVYDRFQVPRLGRPEKIAPPAGAGGEDDFPSPGALSCVPTQRIVSLAEEFSAVTEDDCVEILKLYRRDVPGYFKQLVEDNLFQARYATPDVVNAGLVRDGDSVYYITPTLMEIVALRDRISVKTIEDREAAYLDPESQRHTHQLMHNRCLLLVKRILHKNRITLYAGWRWVIHLNGETQLQPDGIIYAHGPFGPSLYYVEMERTATDQYTINLKWRTYRALVEAGFEVRVIWVTETRQAATRFLQRGADMQVMVTTLDQLRAGPIAGPRTIWRIPGGGHAELKPLGDS